MCPLKVAIQIKSRKLVEVATNDYSSVEHNPKHDWKGKPGGGG
jgi:hypothetical protein